MNTLTLQIRKVFLDDILDGSKPEEIREILPKNAHKYLIYKNKGEENESYDIIKYDAIQFFNGYNPNRPRVLIEVKDAEIEFALDENKQPIVFTYENEEYVVAYIFYTLGKVLERENI